MSVFEPRAEQQFTTEVAAERGRIAARLLDEPVMKDAFAAAEHSFLQEWLFGRDAATRDAAWAKVHALEAVRHQLRTTVSDGQHAVEVLRRRG